jgi:hypothetical protein
MKYPHSVPLCGTNGEILPGNTLSRVVLSSVGTKWNDVVVEQHHFPSSEWVDVMYKRHVIFVLVGPPLSSNSKKTGGFSGSRGQQARFPSSRAISLFLVG